jgi:hypothetical protein
MTTIAMSRTRILITRIDLVAGHTIAVITRIACTGVLSGTGLFAGCKTGTRQRRTIVDLLTVNTITAIANFATAIVCGRSG